MFEVMTNASALSEKLLPLRVTTCLLRFIFTLCHHQEILGLFWFAHIFQGMPVSQELEVNVA